MQILDATGKWQVVVRGSFVLGLISAQLRYRAGRAAALLGALLVAVTSFPVLTGTARSQQSAVVGTVSANDRGAYDLLVRPADSVSAAAVLLTTLAALLPAVGLRRLPAARLLAEE